MSNTAKADAGLGRPRALAGGNRAAGLAPFAIALDRKLRACDVVALAPPIYLQEARHGRAEHSGRLNYPLSDLLVPCYRSPPLASLSLEKLAAKFGRSSERFRRLIRLSYLSPNIIAAIIEARQPAHLNSRFFQHLDGLPLSWTEQEQLLLA